MPLKTQYTKCKVTGQKIPVIFNFGKMPIANSFSKKVDKKNLYEMKIAFINFILFQQEFNRKESIQMKAGHL